MDNIKFYGLDTKKIESLFRENTRFIPKDSILKVPYYYSFNANEINEINKLKFKWPVVVKYGKKEDTYLNSELLSSSDALKGLLDRISSESILLFSRPPGGKKAHSNYFYYLGVDFIAYQGLGKVLVLNQDFNSFYESENLNKSLIYRLLYVGGGLWFVDNIIDVSDPRIEFITKSRTYLSLKDDEKILQEFKDGLALGFDYGELLPTNKFEYVLNKGFMPDPKNFGFMLLQSFYGATREIFKRNFNEPYENYLNDVMLYTFLIKGGNPEDFKLLSKLLSTFNKLTMATTSNVISLIDEFSYITKNIINNSNISPGMLTLISRLAEQNSDIVNYGNLNVFEFKIPDENFQFVIDKNFVFDKLQLRITNTFSDKINFRAQIVNVRLTNTLKINDLDTVKIGEYKDTSVVEVDFICKDFNESIINFNKKFVALPHKEKSLQNTDKMYVSVENNNGMLCCKETGEELFKVDILLQSIALKGGSLNTDVINEKISKYFEINSVKSI